MKDLRQAIKSYLSDSGDNMEGWDHFFEDLGITQVGCRMIIKEVLEDFAKYVEATSK